jgi:hypothetical protein
MGCKMSEVKGNSQMERMKKTVVIIEDKNKSDRSGISEKSCQILTRKISIDSGHKCKL